jgi:hypothetical protein
VGGRGRRAQQRDGDETVRECARQIGGEGSVGGGVTCRVCDSEGTHTTHTTDTDTDKQRTSNEKARGPDTKEGNIPSLSVGPHSLLILLLVGSQVSSPCLLGCEWSLPLPSGLTPHTPLPSPPHTHPFPFTHTRPLVHTLPPPPFSH